MSDARAVLRHVIEAIGPASQAQAEGARALVAGAGSPMLEALAMRLAAAQHGRPRARRRTIVVAAGDHGCGDPGIAMGAEHPTVMAARAIADGTSALSGVARSSGTPTVIVDAGAREATHMPPVAVQLGRGPTRDLMHEPAMTVVDAVLGIEAGIALAISLAESANDDRLALVAVGAIGVGSEVASAALLGAFTRQPPGNLGDDVAELAGARGAQHPLSDPIDVLAHFGGPETAVLAGLILAAASMNIAVILDGHATGAAALVATALAPNASGYLIAAHRGSFTQPAILGHLGLEPIFEVGLGHGEGTGAAMVLAMADQVSAIAG